MTRLGSLTGRTGRSQLAPLLERWIPQQRWFAGKARDADGVRVRETCLINEAVLDVILDVDYADGGAERYQVPLTVASDGAPAWAVVGSAGGVRLADATAEQTASRILAAMALSDRAWATDLGGHAVGVPVSGHEHPDSRELDHARRMTAEQSNTSIVFGERAILKIFRRLEEGENPDIEITRALTLAGFPHAPAQRGAVQLRSGQGSVTALAVLSDFLSGAREGWELACADVDALDGAEDVQTAFVAGMEGLGRAVARLHTTLAERFGARPAGEADLERWRSAMESQLDAVLATATRRPSDALAPVLERADDVRRLLGRVRDAPDPGPITRVHGDLHLGQVLLDRDGSWQILDFEGEPAKPLDERRALHSPLRDVAGMLRSFDYASAAGRGAAASQQALESRRRWRSLTRRRFLDGYRAAARAAAILPGDERSLDVLLDGFELDKAVYELGYELANRPDWLPIPVDGVLRVLQRQAGRPTS